MFKKWSSYIRTCIALFIFIVLVLVMQNLLFFYTSKASSILLQKRFVFVQEVTDVEEEFYSKGIAFDLKKREFFDTSNGWAIKDGQEYSKYGREDAKDSYNKALYSEVTSALLTLKVTPNQIKNANYEIIMSPETLVNKSLYKAKRSPEFEELFMDKELGFSKVRISFNKDFLPTKIDYFYKGEKGLKWYTKRLYSYPYENDADFEKYLNSYLEHLKEWNKEYEAEREAEES